MTRRVGDDSIDDGSITSSGRGSGADPAMLSTAIFSGTGVRSAIGVARMLTNDSSPMCGQ